MEAHAFLEHLVDATFLDKLAAERARDAQRQTRERIDVVVMQLGLLSEPDLARALAAYFNHPLLTASDLPEAPVLPDMLDVAFLRRARMLPLAATETHLRVATADPFSADSLAAAGFACGRAISVCVASASDIAAALARLYQLDATSPAAGSNGGADKSTDGPQDDVQRLKDLASAAPVIRLVHDLLQSAAEARASDIHIEPMPDGIRVRFRIDGVMTEVQRLALDLQPAIASRIKIMSRMNVAERRIPQDGRTSIVFRGREIDVRVATAPLFGGESLVLRLLDRNAVPLDFSALGFDATQTATLARLLAQPNGIVIVTGPTGSGKTTTLYAALAALNDGERKVFTVEDPIEFQLPGINQMQIKPALDLTFASGLRAILRQDPDIVMVGEMRDTETARIGVQAALTGHLVLSTLHTNSAAASVTRLLDMGIDDYLLASTLTGIVAQRLVRTLCQKCAVPDPAGLAEISTLLPSVMTRIGTHNVQRPCGCETCRGTGYFGRTTIAEIMTFGSDLRRHVKRGVVDRDLEAAAREQGMMSLLEHGVMKAAKGETTLAEVMRVARS